VQRVNLGLCWIWLRIGVRRLVFFVFCALPILRTQCISRQLSLLIWPRITCTCTGTIPPPIDDVVLMSRSSLNQGVSSHKKIPKEQSWMLRQYYGNNVVLFLFCACNELFFVSIYLLSFPPPPNSPPRLGNKAQAY
jgi:hypothetical protein